MARLLIDDVKRVCKRLAPRGWAELFAAHGLDITAKDLTKELARPLKQIDRSLGGFEDFAPDATRGIEPGAPAKSLLYHALASPSVTRGPRGPLRAFPTLQELEVVENYVWAARRATIRSLRKLAGDAPLGIVVFACEYRVASRTAHRRHADLTLSRTGLARIGTAPPRYEPSQRGFTPVMSGRSDRIRVSPAKYAVYIAQRLAGARDAGLPMRFQEGDHHEGTAADDHRHFWVPLHKLFSGPECLVEYPDLSVDLRAQHVNEKVRRIHLALSQHTVKGKKWDTGWGEPDISQPPFRFSEGIAKLSPGAGDPPGLVVPVPHRALVEPAVYRRRPLGFNVPPHGGFVGSLDLAAHYNTDGEEVRSAPAYVHARTQMTDKGEVDLNRFSNVADIVNRGGYMARHYLDYTGDGWVAADIDWGRAKNEPTHEARSAGCAGP